MQKTNRGRGVRMQDLVCAVSKETADAIEGCEAWQRILADRKSRGRMLGEAEVQGIIGQSASPPVFLEIAPGGGSE